MTQERLPFDDPFERWGAAARDKRQRPRTPLARVRQRLAERMAGSRHRPGIGGAKLYAVLNRSGRCSSKAQISSSMKRSTAAMRPSANETTSLFSL